jgi:hypothetical protein
MIGAECDRQEIRFPAVKIEVMLSQVLYYLLIIFAPFFSIFIFSPGPRTLHTTKGAGSYHLTQLLLALLFLGCVCLVHTHILFPSSGATRTGMRNANSTRHLFLFCPSFCLQRKKEKNQTTYGPVFLLFS